MHLLIQIGIFIKENKRDLQYHLKLDLASDSKQLVEIKTKNVYCVKCILTNANVMCARKLKVLPLSIGWLLSIL